MTANLCPHSWWMPPPCLGGRANLRFAVMLKGKECRRLCSKTAKTVIPQAIFGENSFLRQGRIQLCPRQTRYFATQPSPQATGNCYRGRQFLFKKHFLPPTKQLVGFLILKNYNSPRTVLKILISNPFYPFHAFLILISAHSIK
jgi:hypothetical protein